jgi:hypothetical protein
MGMVDAKSVRIHSSPIVDNVHAPAYWVLLIGLPALLAGVSLVLLPMSVPMPAYLEDARQYVSSGHIAGTFLPLGFAWLTGLSIQAFGLRGPEVLQTVLYLLNVLSVWALARKCGASAWFALIAGLVTAIYPQLPMSVTKVWDLELAVLLMVLLMLLTVSLMRDGLRPAVVLAIGIVFGASLTQRPNMLLMLPLPAWVCLTSASSWPRRLIAFFTAGALTVLTFAVINTIAHGSFFVPENGAYNLVQGHNEFTIQTLLQDQSCEPSIGMILKADHIDPAAFAQLDPNLQRRYYTHRTLAYLRFHPIEELKISVVKLWTIFRPNTRIHHGISTATFLILYMSLIFPAWLAMVLYRRLRAGLDHLDWVFVAAVGLYVLPFLITACDPRYQIPLEICLLSHMAYMASRVGRNAAVNIHTAGQPRSGRA